MYSSHTQLHPSTMEDVILMAEWITAIVSMMLPSPNYIIKVKKASFDDNKFDLIEVASLGCYYSCAQAVSMMNIFTFGDSKMKALRLMAPHIIDLQNAIIIYQQFNFESEKQKVGEILRSSRISPQNLHIQ